jgi:hypothetical protein
MASWRRVQARLVYMRWNSAPLTTALAAKESIGGKHSRRFQS